MPSPVLESKTRIAALGLVVNLVLAGVKLFAGLVGNSYALIADAIESITDIVGSAVIWSGLRVGARPPDAGHPYGHGKAEALAALAVGLIVFMAGLAIGVESIREIRTPHHTPEPFTLIVLIAVVVVKEGMFRLTRRASKIHASDAVAVDAFHHRADAITSLAAFIGISLAILGPRWFGGSPERWAAADDYAALLAAAVILYNALSLMRLPMRELMDREPTDVLGHCVETAAGVPGVRRIEKARARTSGSRVFVDMHVQVEPDLSVARGHAIGGHVRASVRQQVPVVIDVLVHIEPFESAPSPELTPPSPAPHS